MGPLHADLLYKGGKSSCHKLGIRHMADLREPPMK
eukprot:CAMPEP_0204487088 /NCGR_PEP_ID=MMETSP0471-20130131/65916_1 /ASSEMBLY_ACC=CAM_ASM_000602 /TAXON_ID=2969 /ORGANISM="Oxyrrhis marina" /LENGTH=34 /DNA_ID= /DNA_START= /DNA_END= /DNA_ORIENTATION=